MANVGDKPAQRELKRAVEEVTKKENVRAQTERLERCPSALHCCVVVIGMLVLFGCAFIPAPWLGLFEGVRAFYLFFFRTRRNLQICFVVANLIHLGLATSAYFLASRVDTLHAAGWFWKTLIFGHASYKLLLTISRAEQINIRKEF